LNTTTSHFEQISKFYKEENKKETGEKIFGGVKTHLKEIVYNYDKFVAIIRNGVNSLESEQTVRIE